MSTTIRIVDSISHLRCYSRRVNCSAEAKFHARETVPRINAIMVSGVHGEPRCASPRTSWPRLNVPPLAAWPMLSPQAGRPFATRREIPVDRGRSHFSFRRRFPCSLLPKLCARLLSRARHAHATRFVAFGDVIRFAFLLFSGVFRFVAARHHHSPVHLIAC
jgi:hypothetical protein